MSRNKEEQTIQMLKGFNKFLDEVIDQKEKNKEKAPQEPPTKTKGFDSLVSEEEFEAVKGICEATKKFIDIHNKNALKVNVMDTTPYQRLQYMFFSIVLDDMQDKLSSMLGIHTLDKELLDEYAKDEKLTIEEFEEKTATEMFIAKMFKG